VIGQAPVMSAIASAQDNATTLITQANELFDAGSYKKAITLYEQVLKSGVSNGHLYYNLANAYFRDGQTGKAVAYYRLALLEIPSDRDTLNNLEYVSKNKQLETLIAATENNNEYSSLLAPRQYLGSNTLQLTFLSAYVLSWGCIFWAIRNPNYLTKASTLCLSLICIYLGLVNFYSRISATGQAIFTFNRNRPVPAVVVNAGQTKVFAGMGEHFQVVYRLQEGTTLETENHRSGWIEVQLPQGRKGWVQEQNLMLIQS